MWRKKGVMPSQCRSPFNRKAGQLTLKAMKTLLALTLVLAALPMHSPKANLVKNGDFEEGPAELTKYSFAQSPGWWNRAKRENAQSNNARAISDHHTGFSATVNDRGDAATLFSQKTKHIIQHGDEYQLTLDIMAHLDWEPSDKVRVILYATEDNNGGGNVVWEEAVEFQDISGSSWISESHTFAAVPPAAVGKNLFINFYGVDPDLSDQDAKWGFVRVDNIVLTVK